jgi:LuxR family maltose regulon positive regulatory protein
VWLGRFEEAEQLLDRARRTVRHNREPGLAFLLHYGLGLLRFTQGRLDEAVTAFTAAATTQRLLASAHTLSAELHSRLLMAQVARGDLAAARTTLAGIAPELHDHGKVYISEAVIALAEGRPARALEILAPALTGGAKAPLRRAWLRLEALLWEAVARDQLGDARAAEHSLDQALELAAPERIVLPFVLPPLRELMQHHARRATTQPALLAAIVEALNETSPCPGEAVALPEELSPAELRVLGYLPSALKADEIASELYLSTNTIRTHVRRIYSKLDAHSRSQAVARARELGLLSRR